MTTSNGTDDLRGLFSDAAAEGLLSTQSHQLLSGHLGEVVVAGAAGAALEDLTSSDVTLVTLLVDGSSSIASYGLEKAVCEGQNALLDALERSQEAESILLSVWTFNQKAQVVHAYVPLKDARRLDRGSYRGRGSTALYDTYCDAMAANVAYAQRLRDGGTPTRSALVVITDGEDTSSTRRPADCASLSRDLLATEQFVLGFVGVGTAADFDKVAAEMGVPPSGVVVSEKATPSAIRDVFQTVSRSAIRVSQRRVAPGAGGFFGP